MGIAAAVLAVVFVAGCVTAALVEPPAEAPPSTAGTGAGPGEVLLSADAAAYPDVGGIAAQLQRHFDAINEGDYAGWATTVAPERVARLSEKAWKAAYRSTKDGTIRVDRIDDLPGNDLPGDGVLVRVRFVSTQDLADAPPDLRVPRICWRSTMPMAGSPPRIGSTQGGSSVKEAC